MTQYTVYYRGTWDISYEITADNEKDVLLEAKKLLKKDVMDTSLNIEVEERYLEFVVGAALNQFLKEETLDKTLRDS